MNCELCGEIVSLGKKHIVFESKGHKNGKIVLCKGCVSVGYSTKGDPVVYYDKMAKRVVMLEIPETFVYATLGSKMRKAYSHIAEECGWEVVRYVKVKEGMVYISELFDNSVIRRYFSLMVPGTWHKDVTYSAEECFRRSCKNIRDNYLGWVLRDKK